jgi:hypothetical protein
LDGGTIWIDGRDEYGQRRRITLTQQLLPRQSWFSRPVGRLYLGCRRVPNGGKAERAILALLRQLLTEQEASGPTPGEKREQWECRVTSLRCVLEYLGSRRDG